MAHERKDGSPFLTSFRSPVTCPSSDGPRDDVGISVGGWNCGSGPEFVVRIGVGWGGITKEGMRAAAFLLTISTTAAAAPMVLACATLAAKVAAALLKPPISDFLMFGQKESAHLTQREKH